MINIMIEISGYIFVAISLGYFFGWLITKIMLKERYQARLDEVVSSSNLTNSEYQKLKDLYYYQLK